MEKSVVQEIVADSTAVTAMIDLSSLAANDVPGIRQ
jgi:hypothetical protein